MVNDARGYYKLLNAEPGCSIEEINLAYGFLKYEWEKDGQAPDRKAQEAYTYLSDPQSKADYDSKRGPASRSGSNRTTGYVVLLVILFVFAAFVFPGFLKPSPEQYRSGDRISRSSDGSFLGEIIRREQFHNFPQGKQGAGYLVRLPSGEERWYPAGDLERHYRK